MNVQYYVPHFEVRIAGTTLAADVSSHTMNVRYESCLDEADMFALTIYNADNRLLDSTLCDPGKTVELHMGYDNDLQPMMLGEITALEPSFPQDGPPTLSIRGYDKSYRMRHNQPLRPPFLFSNDSAIAAQIALENGLVPVVDPCPTLHAGLERGQYDSDMALLKARAAAHNFDVYVHWDRLYFQFPRPQTEAYVLEWGKSLASFSPRISSAGMAGLQVVRGYDQLLAQTIVAFTTAGDLGADDLLERLGSAGLDLVTSLGRQAITNGKVSSPLDAAALAKAALQSLLEGLYEGNGSCIGIPELRAGRYVEIRGVGKRFSGAYRLRKVTHTIDEGGYRTEFDITQRNHTNMLSLMREKVASQPPPDEPRRFYGVKVGEVVNNLDPLNRGRVQVRLPDLGEVPLSAWAPCVAPLAGAAGSIHFPIQAGDQVLVVFQDGNLDAPYVIGCLWNMKTQPPAAAVPVQFTIHHQSGSEIVLNSDGSVTIQAENGLTLKQKAGGELILGSKGSLRMTAQNISLDAHEEILLKVANTRLIMHGSGASIETTDDKTIVLNVSSTSSTTSLTVDKDKVNVQ